MNFLLLHSLALFTYIAHLLQVSIFLSFADLAGKSSDVHPAVCDGPHVPLWYPGDPHGQQSPGATSAAAAESRPVELPHHPAATGRPDEGEDQGEREPTGGEQGLGGCC